MKKALLSLNLDGLVFELFETPTIQGFLDEFHPETKELENLARQTRFALRGRLAALLVLHKTGNEGYEGVPFAIRAAVFCQALKDDLMQGEEAWGSLWWEDDAGLLGYHVLAQGEASVPFLQALLSDESPRRRYAGGERGGLLALRGYRLKDFAAFYIAKIRSYNLPWEPDVQSRDHLIDKLIIDLRLG